MKPESVHEVSPQCCLTCRFSGWKRGIMSLLCFHGEPDELKNDNPPLIDGDEMNRWWMRRVTEELGLCDEYEAEKR